jgi:sugar lactone lactonase YvrE
LSSNDTRFGAKPLRSAEDLDIYDDEIYFVDSSYKHNINEALNDIIFTFPGGRLFHYNEKLDKLELLLDKLYHPNGVQLTPEKDALLINEFSMARIVKYDLYFK